MFWWLVILPFLLAFGSTGWTSQCVECHKLKTPGIVKDWELSKHSKEGIDCSVCHGTEHKTERDFKKAKLPQEETCGSCHSEQFEQFLRGKHSLGWKAMMALPVSPLEPEELIEGKRGCGGCHNMGIKSKEEIKRLEAKGYRHEVNSCDECHTRHLFSKQEALNPQACQKCHMGYDHPQWEMWSSSKHGSRWMAKKLGDAPEGAQAPTCQTCHMPGGTHENHTAWGFLGVRLPLPEDPQWAKDRVTILKALGVLDPNTGKPTPVFDAVKSLRLARLTEEEWKSEREKMIKRCVQCHSEPYARKQLEMGDQMLKKADRLMAEAIEIVAGLYKDGILQKREGYPFAYPNLLFFMQTGGKEKEKLSYIEQVLCQMFMKHRMRTYQAFFHVNPDYAYWYGWEMMVKDLGEIKHLAEEMRKSRVKKKTK